jgi:hypothetical protein
MPTVNPSATVNPQRRLRPAAAAMQAGASSMLRLARAGEARLPSGAALSGWAERAAAMLDLTPMMVGPQSKVAATLPTMRPGASTPCSAVRP